MQQEPGTPEEIMNALQFVRPGGGFVPNFPLFAKSDINGANRLPLYAWATVTLNAFAARESSLLYQGLSLLYQGKKLFPVIHRKIILRPAFGWVNVGIQKSRLYIK